VSHDLRHRSHGATGHSTGAASAGAVGKRTLTMELPPAPLQMKRGASDGSAEQPAPSSGGQPLSDGVRAKMETSFGADFSAVRVHEGDHASAHGALGYTQGTDIHFAPGRYQPETPGGQELLGHELAHVVQQSQGRVQATTQAKGAPINDDPSLEREADEQGARAARGESASAGAAISPGATGGAIQRRPNPELDTSRLEFIGGADWTALKSELEITEPAVQAFRDADRNPEVIALIYNVDIDNPRAAAEQMKKAIPPVSDAAKGKIETDKNVVNTARVQMQNAFTNMSSAAGRLRVALHKQSTTPDPQGAPSFTAEDGTTGNDVEKAWDATVELLKGGLDAAIGGLMLTIGGMDLIKDNIKDLFNKDTVKIEELQKAVAGNTARIDSLCQTLKSQAAVEAKQANADLQAAALVHQNAMTNYLACLKTWMNDLAIAFEATKKPPKGGGPAAGAGASANPATGISATYKAIIQANECYQTAKIALATQELGPARLPYWIRILCPTGAPVLDAPDSGKPGSYAGSMYVYEKNGKQYVFHETRDAVDAASDRVDHASRVYNNGPKVEQRAAAWAAAMSGALGFS
jgi:Domain of unknown function (DUF4157)